ncbi:MAG: hypothetical protein QXT14_08890, partial [Candidatus Bathyarchaeia archaeon]
MAEMTLLCNWWEVGKRACLDGYKENLYECRQVTTAWGEIRFEWVLIEKCSPQCGCTPTPPPQYTKECPSLDLVDVTVSCPEGLWIALTYTTCVGRYCYTPSGWRWCYAKELRTDYGYSGDVYKVLRNTDVKVSFGPEFVVSVTVCDASGCREYTREETGGKFTFKATSNTTIIVKGGCPPISWPEA